MTIKNKTRKIIWSKSGNRCAICKTLLVHKIDAVNSDFIVGEECHILSSKVNGPRGKIKTLNDYNIPENLILLCSNHHKMIDDFPETFTYEILTDLKNNHEKWVENAIEKDLHTFLESVNNIQVLDEITNHNELRAIIPNSHFYFCDLSSITDNELSIKASEFFDNVRDLIDIYDVIEISEYQRYLITCENQIKELNQAGIRMFGKGLIRKYKFLNIPESDYKVAFFVAFDPKVNPQSIQENKLTVKLPEDFNPM